MPTNTLKKAETFLKQHQALSATTLSALALAVSIGGFIFNGKQAKKQDLPIWDYKMVYDAANLSLVQINFSSLKNDFKIQGIDVYFPDSVSSNSPVSISGDSWKLGALEDSINNSIQKSYYYQYIEYPQFSTANFNYDFPIVLKFNYVHELTAKEIFCLYKLNFKTFPTGKIKINSLLFVKALNDSWLHSLKENLNLLHNTQFFGKIPFAHGDFINSSLRKDELLSKFASLIDRLEASTQKVYIEEDQNDPSPVNEVHLLIPSVYNNETSFNQFRKSYDSLSLAIKNSSRNYSRAILDLFPKIDSFLKLYPPSFDYTNAKTSLWLEDRDAFTDWDLFFVDTKISLWKSYLEIDIFSDKE